MESVKAVGKELQRSRRLHGPVVRSLQEPGPWAEYYVRVFEKLSKSDNYVAKELSRLDGILQKGGLAPAKADELRTKTNVLRQFIQDAAEKVTGGKDEL